MGVYDVIADFGQARGTNTATILPNESATCAPLRAHDPAAREHHAPPGAVRRTAAGAWEAADGRGLPTSHLGRSGDFYRTLWHEIGPLPRRRRDREGPRRSSPALEDNAERAGGDEGRPGVAVPGRRCASGATTTTTTLRALYASGIRRVLQNVKPAAGAAVPDDAAHAVELLPRERAALVGSGPEGLAHPLRELPRDGGPGCCARCWPSSAPATRPASGSLHREVHAAGTTTSTECWPRRCGPSRSTATRS